MFEQSKPIASFQSIATGLFPLTFVFLVTRVEKKFTDIWGKRCGHVKGWRDENWQRLTWVHLVSPRVNVSPRYVQCLN